MRTTALIDTLTALRALPGAVLDWLPPALPPPLPQALHLGRRASIAAHRVAWYSTLAALVLLAPPPARASAGDAQPDTQSDAQSEAPSDAPDAAAPAPENWAATLVVLAVIAAQLARRRARGTLTA